MTRAEEQLDSIWSNARQAAIAGRCMVDPEIPGSEFGYGLGVGLSLIPDHKTAFAIVSLQKRIEPLDDNQFWYPTDSLHLTLHGITWRESGELPSETELMRLKYALRPAFVSAGCPEIELRGPIIFPGTERQIGTISLAAFPNCDLLLLRDRVRQCVVDAGYPDRRNYTFGRGDYLTCTIARLRKQPTIGLIARIGEIRHESLARFYVTDIVMTTNSYFFNSEHTTIRERFAVI